MTGVPARATGGRRPAAAPDHLGDPVHRPARLWNVANLLTLVRLLLVPVFVLLLVHGDGHDPVWRSFAWTSFAVAMITDLFDGELARRYDLVTDFGKIADPIADKAIMGAAMIGLSVLGDLTWWATAVILFREVGITLMRFWVIKHGVIPASRGGKLKTLTQGVAVGMYVLALTGPLATLRAWLMAAAVALTVLTGLDYVRQAVLLRRVGLARRALPAANGIQVASGGPGAPDPAGGHPDPAGGGQEGGGQEGPGGPGRTTRDEKGPAAQVRPGAQGPAGAGAVAGRETGAAVAGRKTAGAENTLPGTGDPSVVADGPGHTGAGGSGTIRGTDGGGPTA